MMLLLLDRDFWYINQFVHCVHSGRLTAMKLGRLRFSILVQVFSLYISLEAVLPWKMAPPPRVWICQWQCHGFQGQSRQDQLGEYSNHFHRSGFCINDR